MRVRSCAVCSGFSITSDLVQLELQRAAGNPGAREHRAQVMDQIVPESSRPRDLYRKDEDSSG